MTALRSQTRRYPRGTQRHRPSARPSSRLVSGGPAAGCRAASGLRKRSNGRGGLLMETRRAIAGSAAISLLSVAGLAACNSGPSTSSADARAAPDVVVTADAGGVQGGCSPEGAARAMIRFADAYSRGAVGEAVRLIAPEPDFVWFTVTTGRRSHVRLLDRRLLVDHFRARHRQGELLRLKELSTVATSEKDRRGLGVRFYRQARDLETRYGVRNHEAFGKAELRCSTGKITLVSLSTPPGRAPGSPRMCPRPATSVPP